MSDEEVRSFLIFMQTVDPLFRCGKWAQIGVTDTAYDHLIGDMGWFLSGDGSEVELGITLATAHQGQGHATRAMRLAISTAFALTAARRIVTYADLRNAPSHALMRRLDFTELGNQVFDGVLETAYEFRRPA